MYFNISKGEFNMTKTTKRSLTAICIAILLASICFAVVPKMSASANEASTLAVNADFGGGTGTLDDSYQIYKETQLKNIKNTAYYDYYAGAYIIKASFILKSSIVLSGTWSHIAAYLDGTFFGEGRSIDSLKLDVKSSTSNSHFCGLFETIGTGTVKDLVLTNVSVTCSDVSNESNSLFIGALAGHSKGTIINCKVTGSLDTTYLYNANTGGLIGTNEGGITQCKNYASVTGSCSVGGIVGSFGLLTLVALIPLRKIETLNPIDAIRIL